MKIKEYEQKMPFEFHPDRKGAKYEIAGKFKNYGEFCESSVKFNMDLSYAINPATSFDKGSDIEEINASVKSARFSLAESLNGQTFEEQLKDYFERCHSNLWIYVVTVGENVIEYHLNRNEFEEFVKTFCGLTKKSGSNDKKIRMRNITERKVIEWFEARA